MASFSFTGKSVGRVNMLFREVNMLCREAWDQTRRNQCTPLLSRLFTLQLPKNRPSLLSDHTRVLGGLVLLCSLDIMGSKFYNFSSDLFSECTTYASRSTECTEGAPGIVLRTLTKKKKKRSKWRVEEQPAVPWEISPFFPNLLLPGYLLIAIEKTPTASCKGTVNWSIALALTRFIYICTGKHKHIYWWTTSKQAVDTFLPLTAMRVSHKRESSPTSLGASQEMQIKLCNSLAKNSPKVSLHTELRKRGIKQVMGLWECLQRRRYWRSHVAGAGPAGRKRKNTGRCYHSISSKACWVHSQESSGWQDGEKGHEGSLGKSWFFCLFVCFLIMMVKKLDVLV